MAARALDRLDLDLLLLVACGLPESHPVGQAPMERLLDRFMPPGEEVDHAFLLKRVDLCRLGSWLGLGAHFLDGIRVFHRSARRC